MILAAKEGLVSAQCDITAAFVTAPVPPNEVIYVEQPRGFVKDSAMVCYLNSCLYGMKQSPRYFFGYLTKKLEAQGLKPSDSDPCLLEMESSSLCMLTICLSMLEHKKKLMI